MCKCRILHSWLAFTAVTLQTCHLLEAFLSHTQPCSTSHHGDKHTKVHFPVRRTQEADHIGRRPGAQPLILCLLEFPEQSCSLVKLPLEHLSLCGKKTTLKKTRQPLFDLWSQALLRLASTPTETNSRVTLYSYLHPDGQALPVGSIRLLPVSDSPQESVVPDTHPRSQRPPLEHHSLSPPAVL